MKSGTYIGDEQQFKGRRALLHIEGELVKAQFDQGKTWETHSWLTFSIEEWAVDETIES